jgi:hypothetical protein
MTEERGWVTGQTVVGDEEHEHSHASEIHSHDHYHVTHHHTGGPLGEFAHRAQYHEHQHNHAPMVHAHEKYDEKKEAEEHSAAAHVHDHDAPTGGGF